MAEASNVENLKIGIIVLAAGSASRMKRPKQMLEFEGVTLLRRATENAVESIYEPVVVVLGANFEKTKAEIEDLPVKIVFNENWQTGLSSSVKTGIEKLLVFEPSIAAAVIALADQPFIDASHLNLLAEKFHQTGKEIIAAEYNETKGVPALFSRAIFPDLKRLSGDQGAKPIIEKHLDSLSSVNLPEAAFDIDTPEDFSKLTGEKTAPHRDKINDSE